jgi:nitrile hydratase accessory protein
MVFSQPWQARAFALAVALCETGRYPWTEFRSRLIEEVGAGDGEEGTGYYQCWLEALERLVEDTGIVSPAEVVERVRLIEHEDAHDDHEGHEHHH